MTFKTEANLFRSASVPKNKCGILFTQLALETEFCPSPTSV